MDSVLHQTVKEDSGKIKLLNYIVLDLHPPYSNFCKFYTKSLAAEIVEDSAAEVLAIVIVTGTHLQEKVIHDSSFLLTIIIFIFSLKGYSTNTNRD